DELSVALLGEERLDLVGIERLGDLHLADALPAAAPHDGARERALAHAVAPDEHHGAERALRFRRERLGRALDLGLVAAQDVDGLHRVRREEPPVDEREIGRGRGRREDLRRDLEIDARDRKTHAITELFEPLVAEHAAEGLARLLAALLEAPRQLREEADEGAAPLGAPAGGELGLGDLPSDEVVAELLEHAEDRVAHPAAEIARPVARGVDVALHDAAAPLEVA